jgi:hypothetical protein
MLNKNKVETIFEQKYQKERTIIKTSINISKCHILILYNNGIWSAIYSKVTWNKGRQYYLLPLRI